MVTNLHSMDVLNAIKLIELKKEMFWLENSGSKSWRKSNAVQKAVLQLRFAIAVRERDQVYKEVA